MDISIILLAVSLVVIFGFIAELLFQWSGIPDILFLILLGFLLGPGGFGLFRVEALGTIAPVLTTLTLVFLLFNGALTIDLKSFAEGIGQGLALGAVNFIFAALTVSALFYLLSGDLLVSLMLGFALGGVSSTYVIPILKQVGAGKKVYSVMTLEAAVTDVLALVFALTVIEVGVGGALEVKGILSELASLFAVAGMVGICAGFLWIFLEIQVLKCETYYLVTVAYLLLVYLFTEYLGGNGAIAAMFLGIVLANSKILLEVLWRIRRKRIESAKNSEGESVFRHVISKRERQFYDEIAFFLKTFFFVYIGMRLNPVNLEALGIGMGIAAALMVLRSLSHLMTRSFEPPDRLLLHALFARGIAPVVILLVAVERRIDIDPRIPGILFFSVTASILISSIGVFVYRIRMGKDSDSAG